MGECHPISQLFISPPEPVDGLYSQAIRVRNGPDMHRVPLMMILMTMEAIRSVG